MDERSPVFLPSGLQSGRPDTSVQFTVLEIGTEVRMYHICAADIVDCRLNVFSFASYQIKPTNRTKMLLFSACFFATG